MEPLPRLLMVRWRDAYFDFTAKESERDRDDYVAVSVGFEIARDGLFLSLAAEILPDDDGYRAVTHIPLGMILDELPADLALGDIGSAQAQL